MSFQSFDAATSPDQGPGRLKLLQQEMSKKGLAAFFVPRADAHQGEYVAPCDARLQWLTGFTGSAGFAVALQEGAGIFIDGRYRVQVKAEVATSHYTPVNWPETRSGPWLSERLKGGDVVGYDPWLHTANDIERLKAALADSGIAVRPVENLVDLIWDDRPPHPVGEAQAYPIELSGESSVDKRERIAAEIKKAGQKAAVLTLPDSICWLLNIRGSDLPRIPIVQAFAILKDDATVELFSDPSKFDELGPDPAITLYSFAEFESRLTALDAPVCVDRGSAPIAVSQVLEEAGKEIIFAQDPCILPKARKNAVEIDGARAAHLRDAKAMIEFLAWLDGQKPGTFSEIDVASSLEGFRQKTNALRDISFDTIAGTGPNGAIVHYRVTHETNRTVADGDLLLVDSGGQYVDGTTDITRTVAIGEPSREQQECFTRVLQGMIAISRARWPNRLTGRDLDALARAPLWMAGQDYDHGTGHGVGTYLSVHEGPQRLSRISEVPLEPGMILSNEPGYYREGAFGIRIENLIVVRKADRLPGGDDRDMLDFETLTYVPISTKLIAIDLLSQAEVDWLNTYHAEIQDKVNVEGSAADWLARATQPI